MGLKKQHTEVTFRVKPAGGKVYWETILFRDRIFKNKDVAQDYFEWGREGNYVIENFVDLAPFCILEYWKVSKIKKLSDSDLGIRWAMKMMEIKEGKRRRENLDLTMHLPKNFWMSPTGEIFECEWHIDWANDWIERKGLKENYIDWFMNIDRYDRDPYEYMEMMNWIRVQGWGGTPRAHLGHRPTEAQKIVLVRYCWKYFVEWKDFIYEPYIRGKE